MAKFKTYNFNTKPVVITTPLAETLFMSLAEVNEVSGVYGGKMVFTEEALEATVKYKSGKGKEERGVFKDIINNMIDSAYKELKDEGKKVTRVDKINPNTDKDGNETGKFEMSIKNQEKPKIINTDRSVDTNFTTLLSNGSEIKAQLYLKPYTMQGKVGITAYVNSVLLVNVIEYGASNDMFDDDDFDDTSSDFNDPITSDDDEDDY